MKNICVECFFRKVSALVVLKSEMMFSWIGISLPIPMRKLFLLIFKVVQQENSTIPRIPKLHLPTVTFYGNIDSRTSIKKRNEVACDGEKRCER